MLERRTGIRLTSSHAGHSIYEGALSYLIVAGWYFIIVDAGPQVDPWFATLDLSHDGALVKRVAFHRNSRRLPRGAKAAIAFVGGSVNSAKLNLADARRVPDVVEMRYHRIPAAAAASASLFLEPERFLGGLLRRGTSARERLRAGVTAATSVEPQTSTEYEHWLTHYGNWSDRRLRDVVKRLPERPAIRAIVFAQKEGNALQATLRSLREQAYGLETVDIVRPGSAIPQTAAAYTAVLQAGEVLAWYAFPLLIQEVQGFDAVYADEDRVGKDGVRRDPSFKPQPGYMMMCSGLLSRGLWLAKSAMLPRDPVASWAECMRMELWFRLEEQGRSGCVKRVPMMLTHLRDDVELTPLDVLADTVSKALQRRRVSARAVAAAPLRLAWTPDHHSSIDVIVPSRLQGETQIRCMLDILGRTSHPNFVMHIVVTQATPLDAAQAEAARAIEATGKGRVLILDRTGFNYSVANNFAAHGTSGEFICLLNDDVQPIDNQWLGKMAAMFSHPATGIVGAKLYYPDDRVQHAGVIMGLAGLAEHAHRYLRRGELGYMGRAVIDQEMSAVTGACLMIRRTLFEHLGGLDETLASAFNDVDLCLRVRQLGHSVVMAGSVELMHHESISFGHHFAHDREAELAVARIMWDRWPEVIAADPFHNPNLSLLPNSEWELAKPPRVSV